MVNPSSDNYDPNYDPSTQTAETGGTIGFQPVKGEIVKSVVFSQWTTLLDRLGDALTDQHIRYDRLDGAMNREQRNAAMEAFKVDPRCEVLLVSLRAGGVGCAGMTLKRLGEKALLTIDHVQAQPYRRSPSIPDGAVLESGSRGKSVCGSSPTLTGGSLSFSLHRIKLSTASIGSVRPSRSRLSASSCRRRSRTTCSRSNSGRKSLPSEFVFLSLEGVAQLALTTVLV